MFKWLVTSVDVYLILAVSKYSSESAAYLIFIRILAPVWLILNERHTLWCCETTTLPRWSCGVPSWSRMIKYPARLISASIWTSRAPVVGSVRSGNTGNTHRNFFCRITLQWLPRVVSTGAVKRLHLTNRALNQQHATTDMPSHHLQGFVDSDSHECKTWTT